MAIISIPEELKLNRFEFAVIPHARDLVGIHGYAATPASQYTGDVTAPMATDKVHQMQEGARLVEEEISKDK